MINQKTYSDIRTFSFYIITTTTRNNFQRIKVKKKKTTTTFLKIKLSFNFKLSVRKWASFCTSTCVNTRCTTRWTTVRSSRDCGTCYSEREKNKCNILATTTTSEWTSRCRRFECLPEQRLATRWIPSPSWEVCSIDPLTFRSPRPQALTVQALATCTPITMTSGRWLECVCVPSHLIDSSNEKR